MARRLNEIKEILSDISETDLNSLDRTKRLGEDYSFHEGSKKIKDVYDNLNFLVKNFNLVELSTNSKESIFTVTSQMLSFIKEIGAFLVRGNEANATNQYDSINKQINRMYDKYLDDILPIIERINAKLLTNFGEKDLKDALAAVNQMGSIKAGIESLKKETEETLSNLKQNLANQGTSMSSNDFEKQAQEHKKLSESWFKILLASIVITISIVIFLFSYKELNIATETSLPKIIQIALFKLVLLSISYLLIYQSLKNYKVNRHLYVSNKHRQLALAIYPLMSNATRNQAQADIIIAQAAKTIFEQGPTGYLDAEADPNPINTTELIGKLIERK